MLRSLLTLLIAMALAMACVVLSFSAPAEPYEARLARLDRAPAPATTRLAKRPARAVPRSHAVTSSVIKSTRVRVQKRMHAERARGHVLRAHREISPRANWESGADDSNDDCEQWVPGSGVRLAFDDGGAVGGLLVRGSVGTHPRFRNATASERSVSSRPRTISRSVDVPPPRLG